MLFCGATAHVQSGLPVTSIASLYCADNIPGFSDSNGKPNSSLIPSFHFNLGLSNSLLLNIWVSKTVLHDQHILIAIQVYNFHSSVAVRNLKLVSIHCPRVPKYLLQDPSLKLTLQCLEHMSCVQMDV